MNTFYKIQNTFNFVLIQNTCFFSFFSRFEDHFIPKLFFKCNPLLLWDGLLLGDTVAGDRFLPASAGDGLLPGSAARAKDSFPRCAARARDSFDAATGDRLFPEAAASLMLVTSLIFAPQSGLFLVLSTIQLTTQYL